MIISELKEKVFDQSSNFLNKLLSEWHYINANLLDYYGQKDPERSFLNVLTEEIYEKMPNYKIVPFVKLNAIHAFSPAERAERTLGMSRENVRKKLCPQNYWDQTCRSKKCFDGEYPSGTEVDGLIIHEKDFCFLEYENSRYGLCDNFMKIYRLRRLLDKEFESLFITKVTTKRNEDSTTFESFNNYIDSIKPILDKLLENWSILEIVDLSGSDRRRRFHWRP